MTKTGQSTELLFLSSDEPRAGSQSKQCSPPRSKSWVSFVVVVLFYFFLYFIIFIFFIYFY